MPGYLGSKLLRSSKFPLLGHYAYYVNAVFHLPDFMIDVMYEHFGSVHTCMSTCRYKTGIQFMNWAFLMGKYKYFPVLVYSWPLHRIQIFNILSFVYGIPLYNYMYNY